MTIIKMGILFTLIIIVPLILGMAPVSYMNKSQKTPAMLYLSGCFLAFSVFEVVAIPFILLKTRFTYLEITYSIVIMLLSVIIAIKYRNTLKSFSPLEKQPIWLYFLWGIFILIIGVQIYMAVVYEYYDGDDAYYIATSVMTDRYDSMYIKDTYTGYDAGFDGRHALSPLPLYITWISRLSHIHPATIAHSVLSVAWLLLMYGVYLQIGNKLFAKKKSYKPLFMILISIWYMYGNVSLYTSETFIMTRTWQGKGLMAGVVLPAMILCIIYLAGEKVSKGIWFLLFSVVISSLLMTTVSVMLVPTVLAIAGFVIGIQQRNIKKIFQILLCSVPCIMIGLIYVIIR